MTMQTLTPYIPFLVVAFLIFAAAKVVSSLRSIDESTREKPSSGSAMILLVVVFFAGLFMLTDIMTKGAVQDLIKSIVSGVKLSYLLPAMGMFVVTRINTADTAGNNGKPLETIMYTSDNAQDCHTYAQNNIRCLSDSYGVPVQTVGNDTYGIVVKNSAPFTITYHVNEVADSELLADEPSPLNLVADELGEMWTTEAYARVGNCPSDLCYIHFTQSAWSSHGDDRMEELLARHGRKYVATHVHASERQIDDTGKYYPCLLVQVFVEPLTQDELDNMSIGSF